MQGGIERQRMQGNQPRVQEQQYQRQTQSSFVAESEIQQPASDRVADALMNFAGATAEIGSDIYAKKIAEDRAENTRRAWNQELPSDNATKYGLEAHAAVGDQLRQIQAQRELQDWIKNYPNASDEDKAAAYKKYTSSVLNTEDKPDQRALRRRGVMLDESMPHLKVFENEAEREYLEFNKAKVSGELIDMHISANMREGDPETSVFRVYQDLPNMEKSLQDVAGMSPQQAYSAIVQTAKAQAAGGDRTLLDAIQKEEEGSGRFANKGEKAVQEGEELYSQWRIRENTIEIGDTIERMHSDYQNTGDRGKMLANLEAMKERWGSSLLSDPRVVSLLRLSERNSGKPSIYDVMKKLSDRSPVHWQFNLNSKERAMLENETGDYFRAIAEQNVFTDAQGNELDPDSVEGMLAKDTWVFKELVNFSEMYQVEVRDLKKAVGAIRHFTPDETNMHEFLKVIRITSLMSDTELARYGDERDVAFISNYNMAMDSNGNDEKRSAKEAWNSVYGDKLPLEKKKVLTKEIDKAIAKDLNTGGLWGFFANKPAESQTGWISSEVTRYADQLVGAGHTDPERVKERALELFKENNMQLDNGMFININANTLAPFMHATDTETGEVHKNFGEILSKGLGKYLEDNIEEFNLESQLGGLKPEDIRVSFNQNDLMVRFYDGSSLDQLGVPMKLETFREEVYDPALGELSSKLSTKAANKRLDEKIGDTQVRYRDIEEGGAFEDYSAEEVKGLSWVEVDILWDKWRKNRR